MLRFVEVLADREQERGHPASNIPPPMKARAISILTAALLIAALGCGSKDSGNASGTNGSEPAPSGKSEYKIAVIPKGSTHEFWKAVKAGAELEADVVVIDTAGRLHNKVGLMDELGKVKRVIEKQSPVDEVLLVLDATTGQNGLRQAEVFGQVVDVTGIVLTKLDGTAKGGIVVAVQRQLGVPVKLVGLGEGPDDLAPFDPEAFVSAILD